MRTHNANEADKRIFIATSESEPAARVRLHKKGRVRDRKRSLDYEPHPSLPALAGGPGLPIHTWLFCSGRRCPRIAARRERARRARDAISVHAAASTDNPPAHHPSTEHAHAWAVPSPGKSRPSGAAQSERAGAVLIFAGGIGGERGFVVPAWKRLAEDGRMSVRWRRN